MSICSHSSVMTISKKSQYSGISSSRVWSYSHATYKTIKSSLQTSPELCKNIMLTTIFKKDVLKIKMMPQLQFQCVCSKHQNTYRTVQGKIIYIAPFRQKAIPTRKKIYWLHKSVPQLVSFYPGFQSLPVIWLYCNWSHAGVSEKKQTIWR